MNKKLKVKVQGSILDENIKKNAEEMIEQLACSKQASSSDLLIGKNEVQELKKYLTDHSDDINRRTAKFINLLKSPKRSII